MQVECQARLAGAGFEQYEVSGYAQRGRRCRHNLVYWQFGDYLGVGAGAHGKLTQVGTGAVERTVRVRHPAAYLAAASPQERLCEVRTVPESDLPFEFALNSLRLLEGFSERQFADRTGLPWAALQMPIQQAVARGLLEKRGDRWRPTARGRQFLNDLQGLFLPA